MSSIQPRAPLPLVVMEVVTGLSEIQHDPGLHPVSEGCAPSRASHGPRSFLASCASVNIADLAPTFTCPQGLPWDSLGIPWGRHPPAVR